MSYSISLNKLCADWSVLMMTRGLPVFFAYIAFHLYISIYGHFVVIYGTLVLVEQFVYFSGLRPQWFVPTAASMVLGLRPATRPVKHCDEHAIQLSIGGLL